MKRFEIARTPEIQALIAKYENLGQDFVVSDEDLMVTDLILLELVLRIH